MASMIRLILVYIVGLFWSFGVCLQILRLLVTKPRKLLGSRNRTKPPACMTDEVLGMHGYARVNGIRLHYVASGSAGKPLMILLHGFPEFWYSWRHQIRAFKNKYRVVAVDLRGYGESDRPPRVEDYVLDKMVDDVRALIPALGYENCILVGHDWGGAVTWGMASKYPDVIIKAVILNCPHPVAMTQYVNGHWEQFMKSCDHDPVCPRALGQFMKSWYMFFINLPWLPEWFFHSGDKKMLENAFRSEKMGAKPGAFTDEDIEAFKYTFNKRGDFTGPMNYIRASLRNGPMKCLKSPTGGVPICLIWGTRDGALNLEMAEKSRDFAQNLYIKFIEGASHWVQQDEPEKVNECISVFLSESTC